MQGNWKLIARMAHILWTFMCDSIDRCSRVLNETTCFLEMSLCDRRNICSGCRAIYATNRFSRSFQLQLRRSDSCLLFELRVILCWRVHNRSQEAAVGYHRHSHTHTEEFLWRKYVNRSWSILNHIKATCDWATECTLDPNGRGIDRCVRVCVCVMVP